MGLTYAIAKLLASSVSRPVAGTVAASGGGGGGNKPILDRVQALNVTTNLQTAHLAPTIFDTSADEDLELTYTLDSALYTPSIVPSSESFEDSLTLTTAIEAAQYETP